MRATTNFIRAWRDARRFFQLPERRRLIVFYSEGRLYGKYLQAVIWSLLQVEGATVSYLSSDPSDPMLELHDPRIDSFYIGMGSVRTYVFQTLRAGVLVMTMPDLQTFHIKRSSVYPVHYVYIHHSMVSTHMIYRTGAFDHFDSILCGGPHHCDETRAWERLNKLPEKKLFKHGYAPVDTLMALAERSGRPPRGDRPLNVLLAPSWGPNGILERGAEPLVSTLLRAGYRVIVRPHPRTLKISGAIITALSRSFSTDTRFALDIDTESLQPLLDADIMISDWSGVAMEFSFGLERPVLFMNVPRKVNNPRWSEIGMPPMEDIFRNEAGAVLNVQCTSDASAAIERLLNCSGMYAEHARALRAKYLFNPGNSGRSGAKHIAALAAEAHQLSRQQ